MTCRHQIIMRIGMVVGGERHANTLAASSKALRGWDANGGELWPYRKTSMAFRPDLVAYNPQAEPFDPHSDPLILHASRIQGLADDFTRVVHHPFLSPLDAQFGDDPSPSEALPTFKTPDGHDLTGVKASMHDVVLAPALPPFRISPRANNDVERFEIRTSEEDIIQVNTRRIVAIAAHGGMIRHPHVVARVVFALSATVKRSSPRIATSLMNNDHLIAH